MSGKRGPKPTPTETKRKRGSWRASLNPREPMPDPAKPACPRWLKGDARKAWQELCPQLHRMGVLTKIDRNLLAMYCSTWAIWRQCQETVDAHGPVVEEYAKDGETVTATRMAPEARMIPNLIEKLLRLGAELGLSPSSRTRLTARVPHRQDAEPDVDDERVEEGQPKITGSGRFFSPKRKAK